MRHLVTITAIALSLAACEQEPTAQEQAAQNEREIAAVEQANSAAPPLRAVNPEPITAEDIQRHEIVGPACNFAPGTSLGTRVIARKGDAWIRLEGRVERFAADAGSRALPAGILSVYDGSEYSLHLAMSGEAETSSQGTIDLRDRWGRSVYSGTGLVQCGG